MFTVPELDFTTTNNDERESAKVTERQQTFPQQQEVKSETGRSNNNADVDTLLLLKRASATNSSQFNRESIAQINNEQDKLDLMAKDYQNSVEQAQKQSPVMLRQLKNKQLQYHQTQIEGDSRDNYSVQCINLQDQNQNHHSRQNAAISVQQTNNTGIGQEEEPHIPGIATRLLIHNSEGDDLMVNDQKYSPDRKTTNTFKSLDDHEPSLPNFGSEFAEMQDYQDTKNRENPIRDSKKYLKKQTQQSGSQSDLNVSLQVHNNLSEQDFTRQKQETALVKRKIKLPQVQNQGPDQVLVNSSVDVSELQRVRSRSNIAIKSNLPQLQNNKKSRSRVKFSKTVDYDGGNMSCPIKRPIFPDLLSSPSQSQEIPAKTENKSRLPDTSNTKGKDKEMEDKATDPMSVQKVDQNEQHGSDYKQLSRDNKSTNKSKFDSARSQKLLPSLKIKKKCDVLEDVALTMQKVKSIVKQSPTTTNQDSKSPKRARQAKQYKVDFTKVDELFVTDVAKKTSPQRSVKLRQIRKKSRSPTSSPVAAVNILKVQKQSSPAKQSPPQQRKRSPKKYNVAQQIQRQSIPSAVSLEEEGNYQMKPSSLKPLSKRLAEARLNGLNASSQKWDSSFEVTPEDIVFTSLRDIPRPDHEVPPMQSIDWGPDPEPVYSSQFNKSHFMISQDEGHSSQSYSETVHILDKTMDGSITAMEKSQDQPYQHSQVSIQLQKPMEQILIKKFQSVEPKTAQNPTRSRTDIVQMIGVSANTNENTKVGPLIKAAKLANLRDEHNHTSGLYKRSPMLSNTMNHQNHQSPKHNIYIDEQQPLSVAAQSQELNQEYHSVDLKAIYISNDEDNNAYDSQQSINATKDLNPQNHPWMKESLSKPVKIRQKLLPRPHQEQQSQLPAFISEKQCITSPINSRFNQSKEKRSMSNLTRKQIEVARTKQLLKKQKLLPQTSAAASAQFNTIQQTKLTNSTDLLPQQIEVLPQNQCQTINVDENSLRTARRSHQNQKEQLLAITLVDDAQQLEELHHLNNNDNGATFRQSNNELQIAKSNHSNDEDSQPLLAKLEDSYANVPLPFSSISPKLHAKDNQSTGQHIRRSQQAFSSGIQSVLKQAESDRAERQFPVYSKKNMMNIYRSIRDVGRSKKEQQLGHRKIVAPRAQSLRKSVPIQNSNSGHQREGTLMLLGRDESKTSINQGSSSVELQGVRIPDSDAESNDDYDNQPNNYMLPSQIRINSKKNNINISHDNHQKQRNQSLPALVNSKKVANSQKYLITQPHQANSIEQKLSLHSKAQLRYSLNEDLYPVSTKTAATNSLLAEQQRRLNNLASSQTLEGVRRPYPKVASNMQSVNGQLQQAWFKTITQKQSQNMQNKLIHRGAPKKPSEDFTDGSYPMETFKSAIDKYKAKAANNLPREKKEQLKVKVNNASAKLLSNYDFMRHSKQQIVAPSLASKMAQGKIIMSPAGMDTADDSHHLPLSTQTKIYNTAKIPQKKAQTNSSQQNDLSAWSTSTIDQNPSYY